MNNTHKKKNLALKQLKPKKGDLVYDRMGDLGIISSDVFYDFEKVPRCDLYIFRRRGITTHYAACFLRKVMKEGYSRYYL